MPLNTYSWPTSITAGVTTGEVNDTLAAYDRLTRIIAGWGARGPVVAASTSPQALKDTADYNCDGTADQTEINSALAVGRPVLLLPGTYNLSATITIPVGTGQILRGCGWGTVLTCGTSMGAYAITFSTTSGNVVGARLESFKVNANGTNAGASSGGIYAKGAVQCLFDHLWITNPYDAGLWLHEISAGVVGHHNRVRACLFDAAGTAVAGHGQGVRLQTSDKNWVESCHFEGWGGTDTEPYAIKGSATANSIDRATFVGGKEAIRIEGGTGTRITQPSFDGVGRDCIHIVGSGCTLLGGTFTGGGQATAGTYSHIVLDGAGGHSITGGTHSTDATAGRLRSFVRELGTTNNTVVTGKVFTVNGALGTGLVERNAQTGNIYRHNPGLTNDQVTQTQSWGFSGALTVLTGTKMWSSYRQINILGWKGILNTPSAGQAILVDLNTVNTANGTRTSALASQADRISIAAGSRIATVTFATPISVSATNPLSVDIDQVGTTTAGSDLVVEIRYEEVL